CSSWASLPVQYSRCCATIVKRFRLSVLAGLPLVGWRWCTDVGAAPRACRARAHDTRVRLRRASRDPRDVVQPALDLRAPEARPRPARGARDRLRERLDLGWKRRAPLLGLVRLAPGRAVHRAQSELSPWVSALSAAMVQVPRAPHTQAQRHSVAKRSSFGAPGKSCLMVV